jgi:hypothetical protein
MPSTYTVNLGVEKPATGEQAGSWGTTANNNYDFLDTSIDGDLSIALTGNYTLTTTAGAASQGRNKVITWTGTLGANATIAIGPNTAQKIYFMINATSGGFALVFSQGSGPTFTLNAGQSAILYCDGAGLGAGVRGANYNPQLGSVVVQTLTVSGGSLSVATMNVTGTLTAATANITGTLTANALTVNTTAGVAGTLTAGAANVTGNLTTSTLSVTGAATLSSTLGVAGVITGSELTLTRNDAAGPAIWANGNTNPPLRFVAGGAEAMRILGVGTVAIGTAAPDTVNRLQVQGNIAVPSGFGLFTTVGRTSGMWDSGGTLTFRTNGTDNRIVILASGLVGINNGAPAYQLDVGGWIRSTAGGFIFPDGSTQATASTGGFTTQNNVTASRVIGTNYHNISGKSMLVVATVKNGAAGTFTFQVITDAANPPTTVAVEGVTVGQNASLPLTFCVPAGNWYRVVCSSGSPFVQLWFEWT